MMLNMILSVYRGADAVQVACALLSDNRATPGGYAAGGLGARVAMPPAPAPPRSFYNNVQLVCYYLCILVS